VDRNNNIKELKWEYIPFDDTSYMLLDRPKICLSPRGNDQRLEVQISYLEALDRS